MFRFVKFEVSLPGIEARRFVNLLKVSLMSFERIWMLTSVHCKGIRVLRGGGGGC